MICMGHIRRSMVSLLIVSIWVPVFFAGQVRATPEEDLEEKIKGLAIQCQTEVKARFESLVAGGRLSVAQLFDTFYIPIPNTTPQQYHTQYDRIFDDFLPVILDKYLVMDSRIKFVVAVDRNGYAPTHNSRSSGRAKRLFNDRTGLAAARNKEPVLVQKYERDTGTGMYDLSVPVIFRGRHWGAIRIGFTH